MIVTVKTPEYFSTIDDIDLERELIGLLWDKNPKLYGATIRITGVRDALTYHAPGATWPSVKHSRVLRTGGAMIAVRYERC